MTGATGATTTGRRFEIGTAISARAVQPLLLDALRAQRNRLVETLRGATDDEWRQPTRCDQWNVQQVVLHVCGASEALGALMTGEIPAVAEDFDPRLTPNLYVDLHASESTADTLRRLESTNAALFEALDRLVAGDRDDQVRAVWGGMVDWRLVAMHAFWDAWIHERDILLPLGRTHETGDDETRLAVAYGILVAGVTASFLGMELEAELRLGGTGGGRFATGIAGAGVRVAADADAAGSANGDALVVADTLSGRGPELVEVLGCDATVAESLSHLRAFFRAPA